MEHALQRFLAPRIEEHCLPLLRDGYFKHAAREAMVQVELALKDKGQVDGKAFGVNLIRNLFADKPGVRLRVPLAEELQAEAKAYFESVFSYYRNYAAHDGSQIDGKIATRVLIVASELLDLIDASELTLADSGGLAELVRVGRFESVANLQTLLTILDGHRIPEDTYDGLFEEMAEKGLGDSMLEAAFRLGLVEILSAGFESSDTSRWSCEKMESFELTAVGREALTAMVASREG